VEFTPQPGLAQIGATTENANPDRNSTQFEIGRVMWVDADKDLIDVELMNGGRLQGVPIIHDMAGRFYGEVGLMPVTWRDPYTYVKLTTAKDTGYYDDTYAVIAYMRGSAVMPICVGFMPPANTPFTSQSDRPHNASLKRDRGHQVDVNYEDGTRETVVRGGKLRIGPHATIADTASTFRQTTLSAWSRLLPKPDPALNPDFDYYYPEKFLDVSKQLPSAAGFWFYNDDTGAELKVTEAGAVSVKAGKTPQRTVNGSTYSRTWAGLTLSGAGDVLLSAGTENEVFGDPTTGYTGTLTLSATGYVSVASGGVGSLALTGANDVNISALGSQVDLVLSGSINLATAGIGQAKVNGEQIGVLPGTSSILGSDYHSARMDHKHTFSDSHFISGSQIQSGQHPVIGSGDLHPEYINQAELDAAIAAISITVINNYFPPGP
jgi:hypothetical protein